MARVSILMRPEAGHLTPTLRLAAFLRDHGLEVCYVVPASLRAFVERLGFNCVTLSASGADEPDLPDIYNTPASGTMVWRALQQEVARAQASPDDVPPDRERDRAAWHQHVLASIVRSAPDLLVCDSAIARGLAPTLTAGLDRPCVAVNPYPPEKPPPCIPELVLCPIEFTMPDEEAAHHPGRYYCEPSVWRDETRYAMEGDGLALDDPRPLIYCSLGTQSLNYAEAVPVLEAIIAAVEGLPSHHLLIAASALHADLVRKPRPENVGIVPSVPQLPVLARAALFISHGGIGSLKEAIMAGVPSLVIPFLFDQPANARRVEYHGLGRQCPPHCCTPERLRALIVDTATDRGLRQSLAAMREVFWRRESEQRAGHLLLDLLASAT